MLKRPATRKGVSRRALSQQGAAAAGTATLANLPATALARKRGFTDPGPSDLIEVTIAELQARMAAGELTALALVQQYKARIKAIDRHGPKVHSVLELNPDAEEIARALDQIGAALRERGETLESMIESGREIRGELLKELYGIDASEDE